MGFFSKIFKLREQDPESEETTWAFDDNSSETVFDADDANHLAAEFDIDAAINGHEAWKHILRQQLSGELAQPIDLAQLRDPKQDSLGQWLYGEGRAVLGRYPAFAVLVSRHAYFHAQAARMVELTQAGDYDQALQVYRGSYRHASNQVVLLLKQLKRGLVSSKRALATV